MYNFELTVRQVQKDMKFKYFKLVEFFTFLPGSWLRRKTIVGNMQAAETKYFRNVKRLKNMPTQK